MANRSSNRAAVPEAKGALDNIVFSIKKLVPITKKKTSGIDPDVFF